MTTTFDLFDEFGAFASNGDQASVFRFSKIEPALARGESVVIDFAGVTNMTSSFANGLVATLRVHFPQAFPTHVRFRNCCPAVRVLVSAAIEIGRREATELAQ